MSDIRRFRRRAREQLSSTRGDLEIAWDAIDTCAIRFRRVNTQEMLDEWRSMLEEVERDLDGAGPGPMDRARCVARRILYDACQTWYDSGEPTPPGEFLEMVMTEGVHRGYMNQDPAHCSPITPVLAGMLLDMGWPPPVTARARLD